MTYTLHIDRPRCQLRTHSHLAFYNLARLREFLTTAGVVVYHVSRSPAGRHLFLTAR